MIGLTQNHVILCNYDPEWHQLAQEKILELKRLLGNTVIAAQHVGSTAIPSICSRPVLDIVIAVDSIENVILQKQILAANGYFPFPSTFSQDELLFVFGNKQKHFHTHHLYFVNVQSMEWRNHLNFCHYLNDFPQKAKEYENLKKALALKFPDNTHSYMTGKKEWIRFTLRKAMVRSFLGKTVTIRIDRPIGYVHHKKNYTLTYPINYGYIPGVLGGDNEELDVYLLGVNIPVESYTVKIIGIVNRRNDVEDKLIAAPDGLSFTREEMEKQIAFQEQYYNTYIETN